MGQIAIGAQSDPAATGSADGTVIALLKAIRTALGGGAAAAVVDTELAAAIAAADAMANPTTAQVLAHLMGYNGATWDRLKADGGALRHELFDSAGNELSPAKNAAGSYAVTFTIRQTTTAAGSTTVFAMRNVSGPNTAYIRRITGFLIFDGTAAAATSIGYNFARFSAATPTAGSTLTAIKKRNSYGSASVSDIRFLDTGLTTTSVVFESAFRSLLIPVSVTSMIAPFDLKFEEAGERYGPFELASGEGLCFRLAATAVVGLGICGMVEWDER